MLLALRHVTIVNVVSHCECLLVAHNHHNLLSGVGGVMVSIAAFQAVDLGSIPGQRNFFLCA